MPGPALHDLIARRLRASISKNEGLGASMSPAQYAQMQALSADPKNLPYFFLGCQGPDFLFFNTKDMDAYTRQVCGILYGSHELYLKTLNGTF